MLEWRRLLVFILLGIVVTPIKANIFHTVLGLPTECLYQNVILPCRFSFSCWLQGGKNVQGCGDNKWFFSCCVSEDDMPGYSSSTSATPQPPPSMKLKLKPLMMSGGGGGIGVGGSVPQFPKNEFLRRRADDISNLQIDCGIPKTSQNTIQKRIIGGRTAEFAEYPWQAHIRIGEFQCGGVLVSRRYVATAAHCIQQARNKEIIIYLGELDTQNTGAVMEPLPAEKHRVSQKIIHPRFQFRMTQPDRYDLALLKLSRPAGYRSHIAPICLPAIPLSLVGRSGVIAGWGKTEANMGHTGTNILRTASVPIISAAECIKWHESKQIDVELYGEMFCAGHSDGHQDACLGDSGGPLIILDKGRFTLAGITSAGFGCGVDHQPGIYHNVQKTSKWIQDVIYKL